ncbi:MAG: AlwI restriction endonuclease [Cenarchaeum symbiont of Oopsacas minuta]|nr:AlwI restriction endonuclease [Cenarchaeum symbiont of Oopsacas minuta]
MKPWSISTTIRNPERIIRFLHTLSRLENELFDSKTQLKFQIMLIQDKNYRPSIMTERENNIYDDPNMAFTYNDAKNIFEKQNYNDPPIRGRTSFSPLVKMGLCIGSPKIKIKLTHFGKNFLSRSEDMGEYFFNYFLKWQLPNPVETTIKGYDIKPFLGMLHLIKNVNDACIAINKKANGISNEEFDIFVPTLVTYKDIQSQVQEIMTYRKCKTREERKKYQKIFVYKFMMNDEKPNDVNLEKMIKNLHDYGDNAIRYFRMTKYIRIRGNGNFVDLEPRRNIEITELLNSYNASTDKFDSNDAYVEYLGDQTKPTLPWNTDPILQKINVNLMTEISKMGTQMSKFGIDKPIMPEVKNITMQQQNHNLREYLVTLQKIILYRDMNDVNNVSKCIDNLANIYQKNTKHSIELEKQTALAFMALNDSNKIKPNYPVGDDGEPTFTAPGGMADLECYYNNFNMICEVTMLKDRTQWINEGQPVMRHLREFEDANNNKNSYCLFIAPKIHEDTAETFEIAIRHGYKRKSQKIIPITIRTFTKLLHILKSYKKKNNNQPIPHLQLMILYDILIELIKKSKDSTDWVQNKIPEAIEDWGVNLE